MAGNPHVRVDRNACVGNAIGETFAPNVFRLDDAPRSAAIDPTGDGEKKLLEAAGNGPVDTITAEDADTGEHLFPQPVRAWSTARLPTRPATQGRSGFR